MGKTAEYIINAEVNGIEIYFDEKPDGEVWDRLHAEGWTWHRKKRCWYHYDCEDHRVSAMVMCYMYSDYEDSEYERNAPYSSGCNEMISGKADEYDTFDPGEWDEESILRRNGYTVSQEEGLSAAQRQRILSNVIRNRVMSPRDVITHIERMVALRDNQSRFDIACRKWREDVAFVRREFL